MAALTGCTTLYTTVIPPANPIAPFTNWQIQTGSVITASPAGTVFLAGALQIHGSQVTGSNFTFTYADPVTTNRVVATGTFSTDGATLTVSHWTLTGPCGPDSGTGSLTKK